MSKCLHCLVVDTWSKRAKYCKACVKLRRYCGISGVAKQRQTEPMYDVNHAGVTWDSLNEALVVDGVVYTWK